MLLNKAQLYIILYIIILTAQFGGREGVGHTAQHSPSGIIAPGQSRATHNTPYKTDAK